ncbi:DUF397 domain-containing protein [Actinoallomurus purpureus]|nr:DUF397 domain-containing protein [Actinoallomurus purpureus]MCO6004959.1 DUF397 domain-containing protein [Actinoallomurus purpureus]
MSYLEWRKAYRSNDTGGMCVEVAVAEKRQV